MEDCTKVAAPFTVTQIGQLFASWKNWCDAQNIKPGSARTLGDTLVDKGYVRKRVTGGRMGIAAIDLHDGRSAPAATASEGK